MKPELVLQTGHNGLVSCAAFSPDGRWLASGGEDGTVKVWDLATGRELISFAGHTGRVSTIAFSADGRVLASGSSDESLKLWDLSGGREIRTLRGHKTVLSTVEFSADGRWLASVSKDGLAKIWDVSSGNEALSLPSQVGVLALGPSRNVLAVGSSFYPLSPGDSTVALWDIAAKRKLQTVTLQEPASALAFSPDGRLLALSSVDGETSLWDTASGHRIRVLSRGQLLLNSLLFSPDGRLVAGSLATDRPPAFYIRVINGQANLAFPGTENSIGVWEVASGRELRNASDLVSANILALAFSPAGTIMAAGLNDNSAIKVWNASTGAQFLTLAGATNNVFHVALSTSGPQFLAASGDWGYTVKLLDLSARKLTTLSGFSDVITALAFNSHGRSLIAGSRDSDVKLWDPDTGGRLGALAGQLGGSSTIALSPDGRLLASGGNGTVALWDLSTGQELRSFVAPDGPISGLCFSADGRRIASATSNRFSIQRRVAVWDVGSGKATFLLTGHSDAITAIAFSRDGLWMATASRDGTIELWNPVAGRRVRDLSTQAEVTTLAFSPDSRVVISGGEDRLVRIWHVDDGRELHALVGHTGKILDVAFSSDGKLLVSAGADNSVRLWDTAQGDQVALLTLMGRTNQWVVNTPEGLFDGSEQGIQMVSWRIGDRVYAPDRFFADYYTPGLLSRIFEGERPKAKVGLADLALPPEVRVISPASASTLSEEHTTVQVETVDEGGGVAEVQLYQNGKLVAARPGISGKNAAYAFDVHLVPGENVLKATALSKERVESNEDWVRVVLASSRIPKPILHLLVVGINRYEDTSLDLQYARQDGEALADFFSRHENSLFGSVKVTKLFDEEATHESIRRALEQVAGTAQPDDVVLVYLAGHGVGLGEQFYFLPHEMRNDIDTEAAIRRYGLAASELGNELRAIPALKQVLVLDACEAGSALPVLTKVLFRGPSPGEAKAMQMLARANGVYLIAASTREQYAIEVPQLGHGVLAYAILSGLGEKGPPQAATTPEGMVTVLSLLQYVNQQVPELTEKYDHGERQYPVSNATGMDFPLVLQ